MTFSPSSLIASLVKDLKGNLYGVFIGRNGVLTAHPRVCSHAFILQL